MQNCFFSPLSGAAKIINLINSQAPLKLFPIGVKMLHYFLYVNLFKFKF